jgi:hypothetical protein
MELIRLCVLSLALVLHHLIGTIVSEQEPEAGQLVSTLFFDREDYLAADLDDCWSPVWPVDAASAGSLRVAGFQVWLCKSLPTSLRRRSTCHLGVSGTELDILRA